MKKKTLLLLGIFSFGIIQAQVGINTANPLGVFHVDPKGNNGTAPLSTRYTDDFIVDADGHVGIGTEPSATYRLNLNGDLRIVDGHESEGYVFEAVGTDGKGEWTDPDMKVKMGRWEINNLKLDCNVTAGSIVLYNEDNLTPVLTINEIGLLAVNDRELKIPKGIYLVFINQDIGQYEYGIYDLMNAATGTSVYHQVYAEWLAGSSFILNTSSDMTVYVQWTPIDKSAVSNGYYLPVPYVPPIGSTTSAGKLGNTALSFFSLLK